MKWYLYWDEFNKKISYKLANQICGETNEIVRYGINVLINGLEKMTILILIFYLLGYIKTFIISACIMCILRIWMGGTHRNSIFGCLMQSFIIFLMINIICNHINPESLEITISMISIISLVICYCPIINSKRGLYNERIKTKFKIKSIICILLINLVAFYCNSYENVVVTCELVEILDVVFAKIINCKENMINED